MSGHFIPEGVHTITPNTIVENAAQAIEFYTRVFDAREKARLTMPDGKIVHAELQIGDSRLNLAEVMDGWPLHALLAQLYVEDSDAVFARAIAAGAKEIVPLTDMFFGAREGRVLDPFGKHLDHLDTQRRSNAHGDAASPERICQWCALT